MLVRKDGTLVHVAAEKVEVRNPSVTVHEETLPNGNVIRMVCHWGEKVIVPDWDKVEAFRRELEEEQT